MQDFPEAVGQRKIVVDAGDGLHGAAVTVAKAFAIQRFQLGNVGSAIAGQRNLVLVGDHAWHAGSPQQLFARQLRERESVQIGQEVHGIRRIAEHRRDELHQRFRKISGDTGMRQRRAETGRVRGLRQMSAGIDPQTFFLDTVADGRQRSKAERLPQFIEVNL